ncbi:MAG: adenylyl-sulfate kinase [Candidatus Odinarchaeia archaeon]
MEKGFAIWITGLPGSGKSVTANLLKDIFNKHNIKVQILRMDEMRKIVTPNPTYSDEEREIVYRALVYAGKLLVDNGLNVIFDATANKRHFRELARKLIDRYMEVYLKCPIDICIKREASRTNTLGAPRDIYKKAIKGTSRTVPGLQSPYEPPENNELTLETDKLSPEECALRIFEKAVDIFNLSHLLK